MYEKIAVGAGAACALSAAGCVGGLATPGGQIVAAGACSAAMPLCELAGASLAAGASSELFGTMMNEGAKGNFHYEPKKAPKSLEAFKDAQPVKRKTSVQGGGSLRDRWKDSSGNIYEWDSRHGTIEKYNKRGKHLGEFNPVTGEQLKPENPNYRVDP